MDVLRFTSLPSQFPREILSNIFVYISKIDEEVLPDNHYVFSLRKGFSAQNRVVVDKSTLLKCALVCTRWASVAIPQMYDLILDNFEIIDF